MKQWFIKEKPPEDFFSDLGDLPEMAKKLLFYRGIKTRQEAEEFLSPKYETEENNPFKILNMDKAAGRIIKSIKNNERIAVFGDYDADGICASVIFHDFFKKIGFENFHIHIPDRYLEGYGLTINAVEEFAKQNIKLIITLDCGITNYKEVEKANSLGMDTVIIDHHLPPETLPPALAIVDLKQKGETYKFEFLAGAGIAFKTISAIVKKKEFNVIPGWEKWLLDVVAVATVADMVPLIKENRALVHYGLKVLKKTQRIGLISFYEKYGLSKLSINEDDLGFIVAPRLNVAGRMDHASVSFNLLTTQSVQEADWISGRLEGMNGERRIIVDKVIQEIEKEIENSAPDVVAVGNKNWNPGVLGITANRIMEKYNCPVFLWGKGGESIKGSCRSNGAINLIEFMGKLPADLFFDFGGHATSAGFSAEINKMDFIKNEIIKLYKIFSKKEIESFVYIDEEININETNQTLFSIIELFQPFGVDNPKPVFLLKNLKIFNVRQFGNGGIHLQLDFKKSDGSIISAIGFFAAKEKFIGLKSGQIIDLGASLEKNYYRGKEELRLKIVDLKIK